MSAEPVQEFWSIRDATESIRNYPVLVHTAVQGSETYKIAAMATRATGFASNMRDAAAGVGDIVSYGTAALFVFNANRYDAALRNAKQTSRFALGGLSVILIANSLHSANVTAKKTEDGILIGDTVLSYADCNREQFAFRYMRAVQAVGRLGLFQEMIESAAAREAAFGEPFVVRLQKETAFMKEHGIEIDTRKLAALLKAENPF